MLIMEYANKGNLRGCLKEITNINWKQKLFLLYKIIDGLYNIHEKGLIHCDFHDGNILCNKYNDSIYGIYIGDYLESYQLALKNENDIYGVIPFIAPEVLRGKSYTQASDVYSFSMIMWEFTSGVSPFNNRAHNIKLALSICKGERPEIIGNTPQCYIDLMKKCWDEDPLKRPSALEVLNIFENWVFLPYNMKIKNINRELKNNIMEFINAPIKNNNLITKSHSQVYYTSHLHSYTSEELNGILELEQKKDAEQKLFKLEMIAETYFQSSQNELKEKQLTYQSIQMELDSIQQKNSQFEQVNQKLKLDLAIQINEFAKKEDNLQNQIICLQNEKQALTSNLTEQLKQNKLTNQQVQDRISQLEQEKNNLQENLTQTEANIQELKFQQENLIEEKEQLENKLGQSQINYEQLEQEKDLLRNMIEGLSHDQKLNIKLKNKLEKEIARLEQKLINEEQIKEQLTQALQIKEDRINELEQKLIKLDYERIAKLIDKRKELSEIEKELVNKLTCGENTKEIHKEKEAKQKEMNELKQELLKTSASYDANRKKQVLNQVNKFLKVKGDFLTYREEAIKKLQNCYHRLEKGKIAIGFTSMGNKISKIKFADKHTKVFQNIVVKYNDGLLYVQLKKVYSLLMNIVQENKELEASLAIENILKLNSFNLDEYNIFKFATNSQEGTRTQLSCSMMAEDINSLRENLNELKLELKQEKNEIENLLATD
jgi:serine/threonine protein kinase